ncbi:hypothetical protein CCACVL1_19224, partial [Corchorus capsularis]
EERKLKLDATTLSSFDLTRPDSESGHDPPRPSSQARHRSSIAGAALSSTDSSQTRHRSSIA